MQKTFTTNKTILLAILLVVLVCCLTITLTLTCQQQIAKAAEKSSVDELTSDSNSDDYGIMPIAEVSVKNEADLRTQFASGGSGTVIKLTDNITLGSTGELLLNRAGIVLTIDLNGNTLQGNGASRVITVSAASTLNIEDSSGNNSGKISGGYANIGGGIYMSAGATLNLSGGTIADNTTTGYGAGVYIGRNCTFSMNGGVITRNKATTYGGGIFVDTYAISFTMINGEVSNNSAVSNGGGVYVNNYVVFEMKGGTIKGNSAGSGGGVFCYNSTVTISGGTISNNIANAYGGGVGVAGNATNCTMSGATISGNNSNNGAGVYVTDGSFTMEDGTISNNNAQTSGGGMFINTGGSVSMENGTISGNVAGKYGGGVYFNSNFTMSGGTISGNISADCGGGLYVTSSGKLCMSDSALITGNISNTMSGNGGGGVYVGNGVFIMDGGTISNNVSNGDLGGGGVYITGAGQLSDSPNFIMNNGQIIGNITYGSVGGGGVYNTNYAIFEMNNGVISKNYASSKGGGIYQANDYSVFHMYGGTISENTASEAGGLALGAGYLTLSGTVIIKDNFLLSGGVSNLHLYDHTVTVSTISEGAEIFITNSVAPFTFANVVSEDLLQYFHADNTTKCIGYNNGSLVLGNHNLEWQNRSTDSQHWQQCSNCGVQTEKQDHTVSTWTSNDDSSGHTGICNVCSKTVPSQSHTLGEWQLDDGGHYQECTANGCDYKTIPAEHQLTYGTSVDGEKHKGYCTVCTKEVSLEHTWNEQDLQSDLNGHWYACTLCGAKKDGGVTHNWSEMDWKADSGNHFKKCSDCEQTNYEAKHILEHTAEVKATCQEYGYKEYYYCSTCKIYFTDQAGEKEIDDFKSWHDRTGDNGGKTAIDNDAHNWNTEYESNVSGHWHECLNAGCKERKENPIQPHNYNGTYYDGEGKHYQVCVDCDYRTTPEEHSVSSWTSKGSETHQGQCDTCKLTVTAEHTWKDDTKTYNDFGHWIACQYCDVQKDYREHNVTTWTSVNSDSHKGNCDDCDKQDITVDHVMSDWQLDDSGKHYQKCTSADCTYETTHEAHELELGTYFNEKRHTGYCKTCKAEFAEDHVTDGTSYQDNHNLDGHWLVCKVCKSQYDKTEHTWEGSWQQTSDYHFKKCDDCQQEKQEAHSATSWLDAFDGINHKGICVCDKELEQAHVLSELKKNEQNKYYQECTVQGCNYKVEHQDVGDVHEHDYKPNHDENYHWLECSDEECNARKDVKPHTFGEWSVADGNHSKTCSNSECNYTFTEEHTMSDWQLNDSGKHYKKCTVCPDYETDHEAHELELGTYLNEKQHTGYCKTCKAEFAEDHVTDGTVYKDNHNLDGHWLVCQVCKTQYGKVTHEWNESWQQAEGYHFKKCEDCLQEKQEAHSATSWTKDGDTDFHKGTCVCGELLTEEHTLGKLKQDELGKYYQECTAVGCTYETEHQDMGEIHVHTYDDLKFDEVSHWYECKCGARENVKSHEVDSWTMKDAISHTGKCSVCKQEITHGHELNKDGKCTDCDYVLSNLPDCVHVVTSGTSNGNETHTGVCEICGQTVSVSHVFSDEFTHDDKGHWYECEVCHDRKDYEEHELNFATDGEHTHSAECDVCGEKIENKHNWLFGRCLDCNDKLANYSEDDVGIAAVAIVAQIFALIAVAAIISRRMKR